MSEMIERVAIAFYENGGGQMLAGPNYAPPWSEVDPGFQDLFRQIARSAIEAIHEPTKQMIDAGEQAMGAEGAHDCEVAAADIFVAMIAALLSEG